MTEPDQIPDNFDVSTLSEPTPETLSQFDNSCLQLDNLGTLDYPGVDPDTGEVPDFYTTQLVRQSFNNGTVISNLSFHGSDELAAEWSEMDSVHRISLDTMDGDRYEYSVEADGKARLFVKKPGTRVQREVNITSSITSEFGNGISMGIEATPEIMRKVIEAAAERREADKLGLSKPTEVSLKEFNQAIQDALASGLVVNERT